ncbi:MAG: 2-oxo-tetronate isomerase [Chloroflexota bacterium]|nr:2-oxo-tetronate isomerase [Chloroflexota bacterium]
MPNFAANLTMMYNESEFLDRFESAANSGFKGVEYLFPYSYEKNKLADLLGSYSLTQVLHNLPAGDWETGERGIACDPERTGEFQDGVEKAIEYASALNCIRVNCLAGIPPDSVPMDLIKQTFINNLEFAAKNLADAGIRLLIEPINTRDIPGFYLTNTRQALSIIEAVNSDNIYLQYDIYHMQIMEGDLTPTIQNNLGIIEHFQIADTPGRNEPGTGEINYPFLFDMIDTTGYKGWVGCEYKPSESTNASLGWAKSYLG